MNPYEVLGLERNATEDQIREGLAGNLCRCTGFIKIFDSVLAAAAHPEAPDAR